MLTQEPICTDDYGELVFIGHYSGKIVCANEAIYIGPVIPQVKFKYVDSPKGAELRKKSVKIFEETEANCNSCKHLERIKFVKDASGLMPGKCKNKNADFETHPYPPNHDGVMMFAPEDWQGMKCWEAR